MNNGGVICRKLETCELCRSQGKMLYSGLTDRIFAAPGIWNLLRCTNASCGLIWCDPHPLPDQIGKLYESYYTHGVSKETGSTASSGAHLIKAILATIFFWRRPQFLTGNCHLQGLRPGRLLEIGCGSGAFLSAATSAGWDAYGIDFDEKAIEVARMRPGITVETGELTERAFAEQSFDAVVMNNVIEHLWNPIETIKESFRILRPGGRMIIITPNSDAHGHKLFKEKWRGLEPPRHLFIYNQHSLRLAAGLSGFNRVLLFSSSGGRTGVEMLQSSSPRQYSPMALRVLIFFETARAILGAMCGEWCVAVCIKDSSD